MTWASSRANALPETALVVSLALLLLFGAVQEAIFGFDQVAADGATFMGAQKSVQLRGSSASLADAQTVVGQLFPRIKSTNVTIATSSSGQPLFETSVSQQISTIHVPGIAMPAHVTIQSRTVEAGVSSGAASSAGIPLVCYALTTNGISGGSGIRGSDHGLSAPTLTSTFNLGLSKVLNADGSINTALITQHNNSVGSVATAVGHLSGDVTNIVTALINILNLPLVGGFVGQALGVTVSTAGTVIAGLIQPTLNAALSGTATSSQLSGLLGGTFQLVSNLIAVLHPAQLAAFNSAITQLKSDLTTLNTAEASLATITGQSGC